MNDVAFLEYTSGSTGNPKCVATVQWRFSAGVLNEPLDEHAALAFTPQVYCIGQNHSSLLVGLADGCIHAFSLAANTTQNFQLLCFA